MEPMEGSSSNQKLFQNADALAYLKDNRLKGSQKLPATGSQHHKGPDGVTSCPALARARQHQPFLQHKSNKIYANSKKEKQEATKRGSSISGSGDKKRAVPTGNVKSVIGNKDVGGSATLRNLEAKQKRRVDDRRFYPLASGRRRPTAEILIGKKPTKHSSSCSQESVCISAGSPIASEPPKSDEISFPVPACDTVGDPGFQNAGVRPKSRVEDSGQEHLKSVLRVLRSNLCPAEKLRAIKCNKDHWEQTENILCKDSIKATCCKKALRNVPGSTCLHQLKESPKNESKYSVEKAGCNAVSFRTVKGSAYENEMEEVDKSKFQNLDSPKGKEMSANEANIIPKESDQQGLVENCSDSVSNHLSQISEGSSLSTKDDCERFGCQVDRFSDSGDSIEGQFGQCGVIQENVKKKIVEAMDRDLARRAKESSQHVPEDPALENIDVRMEEISLGSSEICEISSVIKSNHAANVIDDQDSGQKLFHPIDCARPIVSQCNTGLMVMHRYCDPLICNDAMEIAAIQSPECEDVITNNAVFHPMDSTNEKVAPNPVSSENSCNQENCVEEQSSSVMHRRSQNTLTPMCLSVDIKDGSLSSNQSTRAAPKSPVTVQDWVDSIDVIDNRTEDGVENVAKESNLNHNHEGEDNLGLGAEAYNLNKKNGALNAQARSSSRKGVFGKTRTPNNSFQSEVSNLSTGSLSSVEALLETMQHDPEDILLGLGFGKTVAHPLNRIPQRFLHQSEVPGNNLNEFLEKQDEMLELYDMGFCGYRGLSGFRMDGHKPAGIVCKILEKIRDRSRELKRSLPTPSLTVSSPSLSFYHAVFSLMAVNAFRSAIRSKNSILDPKNREFLDSQEEGSVKLRGKRRPRLVLGKESFALDTDEELMDDDNCERLSPRPRQVSPSQRDNDIDPKGQNGKSPKSFGSTTSSNIAEFHRTLSDDVFIPGEKKPTLWEIVRDRRLASVPSNHTHVEAGGTCAQVPVAENGTKTSWNCQSPCEDTNIPLTSSELPKRSNRLTRQLSVDEEQDPESDTLSRCHPKLGTLKTETTANKDSFELEELPVSGDLPDEDNLCQLQANIRDAPRTGSAMSDSSGFLEGETLEASHIDTLDDLLPEFVVQKVSHRSSSLLLDSQQSSFDALPLVAKDEFYAGVKSSKDDGVKSSAGHNSPLMNMSESGFESFGTQEKEEDLNESGPTTGGQSPVEYLSESDTVVVDFASSSSGDAISSQNDKSPISSSCDLHTSTPAVPNQETSDVLSTKPITSRDWCEGSHPIRTRMHLLNARRSNLFRSTSEVDLSHLGSRQSQLKADQKSQQNSMENIRSADSGAFSQEFPRRANAEGDSVYHSSLSTRRCERIGEFHESCLLTIQRMHEIMQLYQKKLKQMERTCWDTYHQLFPGVSKSEREELDKLCDLRKLLLVEASKTQMLLSHRSAAMQAMQPPDSHTSCDLRLVTVAEELGELLREQSAIYDQLKELRCDSLSQVRESWQQEGSSGASRQMHLNQLPQLLSNVKHEVMTEVRGIIHEDHDKFQSELVNTRQGIEDVKSVLTTLLSVIKSGKS